MFSWAWVDVFRLTLLGLLPRCPDTFAAILVGSAFDELNLYGNFPHADIFQTSDLPRKE